MTRMSAAEFRTLAKKPKRSKYGNVRTKVDGIWFASKGEARRFQELKLLERAGQIKDLSTHPVRVLMANGVVVGNWIGDFCYIENNERIYEDYKGKDNALSKFKRALFEAQTGCRVRITGAAKR